MTTSFTYRSFLDQYIDILAESIGNELNNNYDYRRFGPQKYHTDGGIIKSIARKLLLKNGLITKGTPEQLIKKGMNFVRPFERDLEWLYERLADQESRDILTMAFAYRALGHRKIKLPFNDGSYWEELIKIEREMKGSECLNLDFMNWELYKIDLSSWGYPITLFARPNGVFTQFVAEQYRCVTSDTVIQAEPGDRIIDAGGCYGDTALYFACKSEPSGQVYSFEFLPANLAVFRKNMGLNENLAAYIKLVQQPLWSVSGEKLSIEINGPGTQVGRSQLGSLNGSVESLSIDDLVEDQSLGSIQFIKMDIEGAELPALIGASKTLQNWRPKLAIAVYHKVNDFWDIVRYIDSLKLDYCFYLRHFTIHSEETILFAKAR